MNRRTAMLMGVVTVAASGSEPARLVASRMQEAGSRAPFIDRPDGTRLSFTDWGSGEPLLFVHAAALESGSWAYQTTAMLRAGHRCIAYDRRGHGRSSVPGTGYDYDSLADDLAAVIEGLDLRGITLIGHSMGCGEVVRYLTRHGHDRVKRIVLLAPTLPYFLKSADNPAGVDKSVFEGLRAEWLRDYPGWAWQQTPAFFAPGTSQAMQQWGFALATRTHLHAILETNITVTETDFRPELPRVAVPTLILHGTQDTSCPLPLTGEPTAKLIPGARLEVIEGAPHGLTITHATQVNASILRFLK